jgi:transposase
MSQPFDLSQFPDLPPEVVQAFSAQQKALEHAKFEASIERAARQHEQAVVAEKEAFITELKELIEKLEGQVLDYRRTRCAALKPLENASTQEIQTAEIQIRVALINRFNALDTAEIVHVA